MIRRHWNELRVGHHVLVHDDADPTLALVPGRVTTIDPTPGSHTVTIRISPRGGPARVVQPSRLAVHLDTGEGTERCWRCETNYPDDGRPAAVRHEGTPSRDESSTPDKKPQHPAGKAPIKVPAKNGTAKRESRRVARSSPS